MIVVDTGPIVAATFQDDKNHERCVQEFMRLHKANRALLVPSFVAAESCYMIGKLGGPRQRQRSSDYLSPAGFGSSISPSPTSQESRSSSSAITIFPWAPPTPQWSPWRNECGLPK